MRTTMVRIAMFVFVAGATQPAMAQFRVAIDLPDLTKVPEAKPLLDQATAEMRKLAQGNEAGVAIKSASAKNVSLDLKEKKPIAGSVTIVFDVHHRHRTTRDGEILGLPGIVAYDRHDEVVVEYDLATQKGRARLAKGPLDMPLLPKIDWELWIPVETKGK